MTKPNRTLLAAAVLSLAVGVNALGQGAGGHGWGGQGRPSREFVPPDSFVRSPSEDESQPGRRYPVLDERVVALSDAVSMVQQRFNATAVKTDTVMEAGQLVYRIRLLSADRSRVWTVSVDARTGRIN